MTLLLFYKTMKISVFTSNNGRILQGFILGLIKIK